MQITSLQLSGYYMIIYEGINVLVVYRIIITGFRISDPLKKNTSNIYSICMYFIQTRLIIAFRLFASFHRFKLHLCLFLTNSFCSWS